MKYYAEERVNELCNSMDGTGEHYAKCNDTGVKDKYHMISPISGT